MDKVIMRQSKKNPELYLYVWYDYDKMEHFSEEHPMSWFISNLNFMEMISNAGFWRGFFDHRKDTKDMRIKYKKVKIKIIETNDRKWVIK